MRWLPGWNSIEEAGYWSHFWFWTGIIALGVLGGSEVISHKYGLRKDELIAAEETKRQAEVNELQEQIAQQQAARLPRNITQQQEQIIIDALQHAPKGSVYVVHGLIDSTDAKTYADRITEVLTKAGYNVMPPNSKMQFLSFDRPGAWLTVNDLEHAPAHAVAIQKAFGDAGIILEGAPQPNWVSTDEIMIAVSSHP